MKIQHTIFDDIISLENLYKAWNEFKKGKRNKYDVQQFEYNLEGNLFRLYWILKNGYYKHGSYQNFNIQDPKPRIIHKAHVLDRIIHHAVFRVLYPIFDKIFIYDSYSCRKGKGTHKAVERLVLFTRNMSRNSQESCYVLKCDILKFFNSIDHNILISLIANRIKDSKGLKLVKEIISSYDTSAGKGLPLGNLTSQLFANIYLHELDKFIKNKLKIKCYVRYTDDFIIVHRDKDYLEKLIPQINAFLIQHLKLSLHPQKTRIRKLGQGIDFLGYIVLPYYKLLRTKTKRRMYKRIENKYDQYKTKKLTRKSFNQSLQSYSGLLKHCNSYGIRQELRNLIKDV